MSAREPLFRLELPSEEPRHDNVVQLPGTQADSGPSADAGLPAVVEGRPRLAERLQPVRDRVASGWRVAWLGDGVLGMRPRPVADLARQFWVSPPPYIRDALILRVPYALYGVPVIAVTAASHLLLLVISYPSLLAVVGVLVGVLILTS